jgi:hypothetical protein
MSDRSSFEEYQSCSREDATEKRDRMRPVEMMGATKEGRNGDLAF